MKNQTKIIIKPLSAELIMEQSYWIHRPNMYCTVTVGEKMLSTTESNEVGPIAKWNDTFEIAYTGEDEIKVQLWSKVAVTKNDFLGEGSIHMPKSGKLSEGIDLYCDGKVVGKLNLYVEMRESVPEKPWKKNIFKGFSALKKIQGQ